jgi:hypothetical protein
MSLLINSASAWAATNPILDLNQIGVESDSGRRKIGDGVNRWRVLDYQQAVYLPGSDPGMPAVQPGDDAADLGSGTADDGLVLTADGLGGTAWEAGGVPVTAVTTTASPAATASRTVFTNEGDADGATVTLPTAAAGLQFTAYVQTAQTLTITAAAGDTIRIASTATAAAGSITSAVVGSSVTLTAINATEWVATASVGSWSF